jgi:hypothetical protein
VDLDVGDELDRQNVEVVFLERFLLPAGAVQILAEIAFLIEQTYSDERKAQIAGGFEVIAGKDAEASRKNGQTFGDAEFQREIGDEEILVYGVFALIPGTLRGEVRVEAFGDALQVREEGIIAGGGFQHGLLDAAQHADGIASGGFPEVAIEAAKEIDGGVVPAPTEIVGDLQKRFQGIRE